MTCAEHQSVRQSRAPFHLSLCPGPWPWGACNELLAPIAAVFGSSVQALPLLHVSDLPWVGSRKWGSPPNTPNHARYPDPEFRQAEAVLDLPPARSFSGQPFPRRAAVASPEQKLAVFTSLHKEGVWWLVQQRSRIDMS